MKNLLSPMSRRKLRSPLKAKPLRLPGQSLDEEIERLLSEKVDSYAIVGCGMIGIAVFEWFHVLLNLRPMPLLISAVAVAVTGYAAFRLIQLRGQIRNLKLGRDGERVFGQFLDDELRRRGYYVLHDFVGGKWNIDHILVGERGIYTVETKTPGFFRLWRQGVSRFRASVSSPSSGDVHRAAAQPHRGRVSRSSRTIAE